MNRRRGGDRRDDDAKAEHRRAGRRLESKSKSHVKWDGEE
jgi:hypothetical protein